MSEEVSAAPNPGNTPAASPEPPQRGGMTGGILAIIIFGTAIACLVLGLFLGRLDRTQRPPVDEAAIERMLTEAGERVAERNLAAGGISGETWELETALTPGKLHDWMTRAMSRVNGVAVNHTPLLEPGPETEGQSSYLLQFPEESRLRLCLALDALGLLKAPEYEDSVAPDPGLATGEVEADLPPNLDGAGPLADPPLPQENPTPQRPAAEAMAELRVKHL